MSEHTPPTTVQETAGTVVMVLAERALATLDGLGDDSLELRKILLDAYKDVPADLPSARPTTSASATTQTASTS